MTPPGQAAAASLTARREQVRAGRLALLPPALWDLHPIEFERLRPAIEACFTCPNCNRRTFTTYVYFDLQDRKLIAFRHCTACRHSWEL